MEEDSNPKQPLLEHADEYKDQVPDLSSVPSEEDGGAAVDRMQRRLLAEGAKSLQLHLRDRFRVAGVDYHRRRNLIFIGGGYFSSTVQRWLDRFSDFRRDTLPSSSTFYRKREKITH